MLNILEMVILIIILFIIFLLYIGVKVSLIYDKKGNELTGCLKILVLKKIKVYSLEYPSDDDEEEIEEEEDDEKPGRDLKELFELAKPCFKYFKEFIKSTTHCIKVKQLRNHLIFGLDSYADTAKYIGYIWSVLIVINSTHENAKVTAEPSFNGSVIDAEGINEVDINILKLIPPIIRLISKREVITLIKGVLDG